jgi:hypothetical protein
VAGTVRVAVLAAMLLAAAPSAVPAAGAGVAAAPATVADFNGDGIDDLVVGVPGEDVGSAADAGAVVVLVGPTLHALLTQGGPATAGGLLPGATESGDLFAAALAA